MIKIISQQLNISTWGFRDGKVNTKKLNNLLSNGEINLALCLRKDTWNLTASRLCCLLWKYFLRFLNDTWSGFWSDFGTKIHSIMSNNYKYSLFYIYNESVINKYSSALNKLSVLHFLYSKILTTHTHIYVHIYALLIASLGALSGLSTCQLRM